MASFKKRYVIFAGVNGSGKSTLYNLRSEYSQMPRINVDELVRKYGKWNDTRAQFKAGKEAVKLLKEYLKSDKSFNQEVTFCGNSIIKSIKEARNNGFIIEVHYIGVNSVDICKNRIKHRVTCGGHDIPDKDVERRYVESIINIKNNKDLCDKIFFYDNTDQFQLIAVFENSSFDIRCDVIPDWFNKIIA